MNLLSSKNLALPSTNNTFVGAEADSIGATDARGHVAVAWTGCDEESGPRDALFQNKKQQTYIEAISQQM